MTGGLGGTNTNIIWITGMFMALGFLPANTQLVRAKWTLTMAPFSNLSY
jgi:hypothetical protein